MEEKIIHNGFVKLVSAKFDMPNGPPRNFDIVRHRPCVAFLPVTKDKFILITQFRPAINCSIMEVPAGHIEEGETVEDAVTRECQEEVGLFPHTILPLGRVYTSPGFTDEVIHLFAVTDCTESTKLSDEDTPYIKKLAFHKKQLDNNFIDQLFDSKTIVTLLKFKAIYGDLWKE